VEPDQPILPALALSGLLVLSPSVPAQAAGKETWSCRPKTTGSGWECVAASAVREPTTTAAPREPLIDTKFEADPPSRPAAHEPGAPPAVVGAAAPAPETADTASGAQNAPAPHQVTATGTAAARAVPAPIVAQAVDEAEETQDSAAAATGTAPAPSVPTAAPQEVLPTREPTPTVPPAEADAAPMRRTVDLPAVETQDAYSPWALCKPWPPLLAPAQSPMPSPAQRLEAPIRIAADEVQVTREHLSTYRGGVEMQRADQQMRADEASYDAGTERFQAQGDVRYREEGFEVAGSAASMDFSTDQGEIADAEYRIETRHARGTASRVFLEGPDTSRLSRVTYTTCNPGNEDWMLRARRVTLNKAEGQGQAQHVTVAFKGVPFLYAPYLSFPIDDRRKSGFLWPSIGSSDATGLDLSIPYYWNIAPHRDATITPRIMTDRGVQLIGEFRYLNPGNQGALQLEFLPNDDVTGDNRGAAFFRHNGLLAPRWTTDINLNYVSDDDYFEDFGSNVEFLNFGSGLELTSLTHLERRADVMYHGNGWSFLGRVQGYQTIDETIGPFGRPYYRLPQFVLNANFPNRHYGLTYRFRGELVKFQRDDTVTGTRLDLTPGVSLPLGGAAYFVTPSLSLRHTQYQLQDAAPDISDSPSRTLPIFSLDSGLFLERDVRWGSTALVQTLEPRLFYLYVPFRNQDRLIVDEETNREVVFDSSQLTFSFARLFSENRFTGADRVGDANQITLALTSRFLRAEDGHELMHASIGQIYYIDDPRVALPGARPTPDDGASDILGEIGLRPHPHWSASATVQWDPDESEMERSVFRFLYRPEQGRVVSFSYRQLRDEFLVGEPLEQTDLGFLWPITRQWHFIGRWLYSLEDKKSLETLAGIEYESCCWALRLVARNYAVDDTADRIETNNAIYVQLILKGLGDIGENIDDLLENGILGYQSHRLR